jgi:hypothetical protein
MTLYEFWRRLHGRGWHQNPDLDHTGDVTHGHAARVALMGLRLWPEDLALCAACVAHDAGEWMPGDAPQPGKEASPAFAGHLHRLEAQAITDMGLGGHDTTDPRVKVLDRLDRYLWAGCKTPWVLITPEWVSAREGIREQARTMGAQRWEILSAVEEAAERAGA